MSVIIRSEEGYFMTDEEFKDLESRNEEIQENHEHTNETQETVKNEKKGSSFFIIGFCISMLLLIGYYGYTAIREKTMGSKERIELVNSMIRSHDTLYSSLSNYSGKDYTVKFKEYLEYLTENVLNARYHVKKIFRSKPRYKFNTKYQQLIGGRSKKEYYKNIKRGFFMITDYKRYLKKAKYYAKRKKKFKRPLHKIVGRPFKRK